MADLIIAPFSNSDIRDWPARHFTRLVELLDARHGAGLIRIIGASSQRLRANEIVRGVPADRVVNECGRLAWPEVEARLRDAACVIGNNSGIAHLSAQVGAPTVCIFGGAHQRMEWRPLGFNVALVSQAIGCAPCMLHRAADCPYDLACLTLITPETVCEAAMDIMKRVGDMNRHGAPEHSLQGLLVA